MTSAWPTEGPVRHQQMAGQGRQRLLLLLLLGILPKSQAPIFANKQEITGRLLSHAKGNPQAVMVMRWRALEKGQCLKGPVRTFISSDFAMPAVLVETVVGGHVAPGKLTMAHRGFCKLGGSQLLRHTL